MAVSALSNAQGESSPRLELRAASLVRFPGTKNASRHRDGHTDCNSPAHWDGDTLYVFNSWEQPWRTSGPDLFHLAPLSESKESSYDNPELKKLWIWLESTHRDQNGVLYGWFHNEVPRLCRTGTGDLAGYPIVVRMGALRSKDNGLHWDDLGFFLEGSATSVLCDTEDVWYAGGVGDFCVLPDAAKQYFYIFFTSYSNRFSEQGLCLARLRYEDRDTPRGKAYLWDGNGWREPGIGGRPNPFFPATQDLTRKDGQTFWGPSIHWNTYLNQYVMLLNRVKNTAWATEGLYVSYSRDLGDPNSWSKPVKFMDGQDAIHADPEGREKNGWYVQAMGTKKGETDKLAGRNPRLFVDGVSRWELDFRLPQAGE